MHRDKEASDQERYVICMCGLPLLEGREVDGELLLGQSFQGIRVRFRVDREGGLEPGSTDPADEEDQDH